MYQEPRKAARDQYLFGAAEDIEKRYRSKYIPGQQIYLREANPFSNASTVIDNNDFNNPIIVTEKKEIDALRSRASDFV